MAIIAIPKILTDRLTDEGARALAEMFREVEASVNRNILQTAQDRFERRLTEEMGKMRAEMHDGIGGLRAEMHDEIGNVRGEMGKMRADVIKWMFIFWIGQAATVIGIMQAFLPKH